MSKSERLRNEKNEKKKQRGNKKKEKNEFLVHSEASIYHLVKVVKKETACRALHCRRREGEGGGGVKYGGL